MHSNKMYAKMTSIKRKRRRRGGNKNNESSELKYVEKQKQNQHAIYLFYDESKWNSFVLKILKTESERRIKKRKCTQ